MCCEHGSPHGSPICWSLIPIQHSNEASRDQWNLQRYSLAIPQPKWKQEQLSRFQFRGLDAMSDQTYSVRARSEEKVLVWLRGEIVTPPFSAEARRESGALLRQLQQGVLLSLPQSRPMPNIGARCHELRITDKDGIWRIIYRIEPDAIVVLDVFPKKTQTTPKPVIEQCKARLAQYLKTIR